MKKLLNKWLPHYMYAPLLILVFSNLGIYYGAKLVNEMLGRPYINMTGVFEAATPVIPAFTVIYIAAFPFWYISYYLLCRSSRELCHEVVLTDVVAKILCGILFILIPTTNIRPMISGTGLGESLLRFIYLTDTPYNLFPSVHCLESWLCFSYIRDRKVNIGVRIAAFVMAVAVCLSTVFTVQHVWIDMFAGILIAEFCKVFVPYISGVMTSSRISSEVCPPVRRTVSGSYRLL